MHFCVLLRKKSKVSLYKGLLGKTWGVCLRGLTLYVALSEIDLTSGSSNCLCILFLAQKRSWWNFYGKFLSQSFIYPMEEIENSDYLFSDEEVSTNKERHSRLGEDILDDTLEYDFADQCLKMKEFEDLNAKNDDLLTGQNIGQEVEAEKFPDSMGLTVSVSLTPIPRTQACVPCCVSLNPCISYLKAENSANLKEVITDLEGKTYQKLHVILGRGNEL